MNQHASDNTRPAQAPAPFAAKAPNESLGYSRSTRVFLGAAFLLLLLGLGNVIYGTLKIQDSHHLLSSAKRELSRPNSSSFPLVDSSLTADQGTLKIRHIQERLEYYRLVRSGGNFFMLTGVACLLLAMGLARKASTPAL